TTAPATTTAPVTTAPTPIVVTPTFAGDEVTYDGAAHSIAVTDLPAGSSVLYSVNDGADVSSVSLTDAGVYTVVAKITVPDGYAPVANMTATLKINPKTVDVSGVTFEDGTAYYDEEVDAYTHGIADLPEGVTVSYTIDGDTIDGEPGNTATGLGIYTIVATLAPANGNYTLVGADENGKVVLDPVTFEVKVGEEHVMTGIGFVGGSYTITFGDELPEMKINEADLPAGDDWAVTVTYEYYLDGNPIAYADIKNAVTYTVKAVFTTNRPHHKNPDTIETTLTIAKAKINVKNSDLFAFGDDAKITKEYTGSAPSLEEVTKYPTDLVEIDGYAIKDGVEAINVGEYKVVVTFKLKDSVNYEFENGSTLEADLEIIPQVVTLADLGLSWNYANMEGYNATANAIHVVYGQTFSYEMTLDAASLAKLEERGITVSYTTTDGSFATVTAPVTLRGVYATEATFSAEGGNYTIADTAFTMEIDWAISTAEADSWTPIVKPELS
ncbi:MAG: hypothetical protein J6V07_02135, partial [Clostridia bacterium]|nr:hypothetical protein [Clostridia bacterium]